MIETIKNIGLGAGFFLLIGGCFKALIELAELLGFGIEQFLVVIILSVAAVWTMAIVGHVIRTLLAGRKPR